MVTLLVVKLTSWRRVLGCQPAVHMYACIRSTELFLHAVQGLSVDQLTVSLREEIDALKKEHEQLESLYHKTQDDLIVRVCGVDISHTEYFTQCVQAADFKAKESSDEAKQLQKEVHICAYTKQLGI